MTECPCGSKVEFEKCCDRFLEAEAIPETAEQLMRSRYTAYVVGDIEYIEKTYLNEEDDFDYEGTKRWALSSEWNGLTIKATQKGQKDDDTGVVEFIAYYTDSNGKSCYHQEKSHFVKVDGHWLFTEGTFEELAPLKREAPKVGRNEPCPCGSGKKFKKCCGK